MTKVFVGADPHRLPATVEVIHQYETVLATGRFATDKAGYAAMRKQMAAWLEGLGSGKLQRTGRPLVQRLLADGEHVVDVPDKLSGRARLFDTGHNRKTDAHAVAVVAARTRTFGCRPRTASKRPCAWWSSAERNSRGKRPASRARRLRKLAPPCPSWMFTRER